MGKVRERKNFLVFRNRNYTLYFMGILVSSGGTILSQFATNLFLLDLTGTASLMSLYLSMNIIVCVVLSPFIGPLIDRVSKVRLLVICDFLFGATDLMLAALLFMTRERGMIIAGIFINGLINGVASSVYAPASNCMVPLMVSGEEQLAAYSCLSTMRDGLRVVGMMIAAGAYALLGYRWILVINGLSFILSAVSEIFIRIDEGAAHSEEKTKGRYLSDMLDGIRILFGDRALAVLMCCGILLNIALSGVLDITVPFMLNTRLRLSPFVLASGEAVFSVGSILSALLLARRANGRLGRAFIGGTLGFTASYFLLTANYGLFVSDRFSLPVFWAVQLISMLFSGWFLSRMCILTNTVFASRTEKDCLGRMAVLRGMASQISLPAAQLGFAWLVDHTGVGVTLAAGSLLMLGCFVFTATRRRLREL